MAGLFAGRDHLLRIPLKILPRRCPLLARYLKGEFTNVSVKA